MTLLEDFFARGWKKGITECIAVVALNMHSLGVERGIIIKSTGLSEEELDKLIKENEGHLTGGTTEPYVLN